MNTIDRLFEINQLLDRAAHLTRETASAERTDADPLWDLNVAIEEALSAAENARRFYLNGSDAERKEIGS